MKKYFIASLMTLLLSGLAYAQDIDIEFGYDDFNNPQELLFLEPQVNSQGFQVVTGDFTALGSGVFTENPGFITEATEEPGGIRVNPFDSVSVRFLNGADTSIGAGFVSFYNPSTGQLDDTGSLQVTNQADEVVTLFGSSVPANDLLLLAQGSDGSFESNAADPDENQTLDDGQIHNHLEFRLPGGTSDPIGAYGFLFQLESDFAIDGTEAGDGNPDLISAPTLFVFNNGLTPTQFVNEALPAFGVGTAVPEPTTGILLVAASGAILTRRRRRM